MTECSKLFVVSKRPGYVRHQGKKEKRRRLRQIHDGKLTGTFVSEEARYAAFGLHKV